MEGYDQLMEASQEQEQKLREELATLQASSVAATQELEARVVKNEGLLVGK